jgi:hypothetical protein
MNNDSLAIYVAGRLKSGSSPSDIREDLLAVGWPEDTARAAVAQGLAEFGVPVPNGRNVAGAGRTASTVEIILSLFSFILLGVVATALGVLYYQVINHFFPDPLTIRYSSGAPDRSAIHYGIAALVVAFPLYVAAIRIWFRRFREDEEHVESKLTKWLTYLVLLISAVTIVGDLITTVFYFLRGELSVRFILKALTILAIAGSVFGFYFLERRKIQYGSAISRQLFQNFGWGISALIVIGVVLGFIAGGSPATERKRGFDTQRESDLRSLANCVAQYAADRRVLPETLDDLSASTAYGYCSESVIDPETGTPYEYRVVAPLAERNGLLEGTAEFCASFALPSDEEGLSGYTVFADKWTKHDAGRSCDEESIVVRIDPTLTVPAKPDLKEAITP